MEAKFYVLMVWFVICLYMNKVIAWLGCRLFVDMVSQLSLEYNVSHCLIGEDLWMLIYVCIICQHVLYGLFENCMLIDMIVQMMHGYYAWFKMSI